MTATSPGFTGSVPEGDALGTDTQPYFDPDEIDSIKVTVDRREKRLQDYAGSATAFTERDLDRVGVTNVRNMSSTTPYLEIGNQEANTEIYIRGVGSDNNTELGDPAAATHIDGIYIPRPRGVGSMFFDLERVELNRGPQGTLRGRNATAGSLNLVTAKPKLGEWGAEGSFQLGNYSQRLTRAMVNIPIGQRLALRVAAFSEVHEPFYENGGPVHTLRASESADVLAYRASAKWLPIDQVTITVQHDLTQERGTGFNGTNFSEALLAGIQPDEIKNPRKVVYRGAQGSLDLLHWGVHGNVNVDLGPVQVEYLSSYRDMDYESVSAGNAGLAFPGAPPPDIDNWGTSYWEASSRSVVQELRIFSPDESRFRWTAGGFFFREKQAVFLGSTNDKSTGYLGNEFNMPDVTGTSWAGYADGTFDIIETLRATAGIRLTTESKERTGIGSIYGLNGVTAPFRYGTEGFKFAGRDRADFTAPTAAELDADGNVAPPFNDFRNGIDRFGARDTLQATLAAPGVSMWNNIREQRGTYSDTFLDFRAGVDTNVTPDNLLYLMFSTGHKSGGFNDNVTTLAGQSIAPTYKPEAIYATELGSKNEFLERRLITNVSGFWYAYTDMQFQTIQALGDPGNLPPGQAPPSTALRQNAATARLLGLEVDATWRLPAGLQAGLQAMLLSAQFTDGEVNDTRVSYEPSPDNVVSLNGRDLPRAPRLSLNYSLSQTITTPIGYFDWLVSGQTKTKHYMTVFNGEGYDNEGNVNPLYSDVVPTFTRFDAGVGYARPDGMLRIDAFVNNLTNVAHMTSLINVPNLNLRFFNPPRQMGVRLSMYL